MRVGFGVWVLLLAWLWLLEFRLFFLLCVCVTGHSSSMEGYSGFSSCADRSKRNTRSIKRTTRGMRIMMMIPRKLCYMCMFHTVCVSVCELPRGRKNTLRGIPLHLCAIRKQRWMNAFLCSFRLEGHPRPKFESDIFDREEFKSEW